MAHCKELSWNCCGNYEDKHRHHKYIAFHRVNISTWTRNINAILGTREYHLELCINSGIVTGNIPSKHKTITASILHLYTRAFPKYLIPETIISYSVFVSQLIEKTFVIFTSNGNLPNK
jgi:hypothetical protein